VRRFYEKEQKAPANDAIREMLDLFCARAQFDGPTREVGTRVLRDGEALYINLGNDEWSALEIQNSRWRIVPESPARFTRTNGMGAMPTPDPTGSLELIKTLLPLSEGQFTLIAGWLVGAWHPTGPYPILVLMGEHGSAKSTLARSLRKLTDPFTPLLRSVPKDERDLILAATNSWTLAFDNLSGLPQWLSDALCRISTGGGLATRKLYSDNEEILFDAKRPIILNGIEDIARSPDLGDRSIILTLPPIAEARRLTESTYWARFEQIEPRILGGLLNAVAAAHHNISRTSIPKPPRMADFANWVCAATPALPFSAERFLEAYRSNRSESIASTIESSALASAVQSLAATQDRWEGTYGELLEILNQRVTDETKKSKAWPKNPRWLSSLLRKFGSPLRAAGCAITELSKDPKTRRRRIAIEKIDPSCQAVAAASDGPSNPIEETDANPWVEELL
jgi:hypothetical protein